MRHSKERYRTCDHRLGLVAPGNGLTVPVATGNRCWRMRERPRTMRLEVAGLGPHFFALTCIRLLFTLPRALRSPSREKFAIRLRFPKGARRFHNLRRFSLPKVLGAMR